MVLIFFTIHLYKACNMIYEDPVAAGIATPTCNSLLLDNVTVSDSVVWALLCI